MARTRWDPARRIKDVLQHCAPLPAEAEVPILHFELATESLLKMLIYFERKIGKERIRRAVYVRHMTQQYRMMLLQLIETFERYLKELAAVCVDHVAEFVLDKRFDAFQIRGGALTAHFQEGSVGKALCESETWLDCKDINDRFRKIHADHFEPAGTFYVFPTGNQPPPEERFRYPIVNTLWQLRHTLVHNVGVVTRSDAVKFRLQTQEPVASPGLLLPTRDDLLHVKRFLDETVQSVNRRVGARLAELLTSLRASLNLSFDPQERADQLTRQLNAVVTVAGATGVLPPP